MVRKYAASHWQEHAGTTILATIKPITNVLNNRRIYNKKLQIRSKRIEWDKVELNCKRYVIGCLAEQSGRLPEQLTTSDYQRKIAKIGPVHQGQHLLMLKTMIWRNLRHSCKSRLIESTTDAHDPSITANAEPDCNQLEL